MRSFKNLDIILQDVCARGALAGLTAMASAGNKMLWQAAFGQRSIGGPAVMTQDTLFWVASMTKAVTAVAALQLVEKGMLSLDTPVAEWVPQLASPQVLDGFAADGTPLLRAAKTAVTLRHLMTHTSGLAYDMWNGDMKAWLAYSQTPPAGSGQLAALNVPLMRDPGTRWEYSTGIDFVGRAVEAASGQRLDHYFAQHIFAQLGMVDTTFLPSVAQRERTANMHKRLPDGTLKAVAFGGGGEPEFFSGGGGLYSTAPDYMRFLQALLSGGATLLQPSSMALLMHNQIGDLAVTPMRSQARGASNDAEFWPGSPKKWTLGFLLNTQQTPEGRSAGSLAWAGLSNCYYWLDPNAGVCGLMMMQVLPFYDADCLAAFRALERAVYGVP